MLVSRAALAQSGAISRIAFLGNSTAELETNLVEPSDRDYASLAT